MLHRYYGKASDSDQYEFRSRAEPPLTREEGWLADRLIYWFCLTLLVCLVLAPLLP